MDLLQNWCVWIVFAILDDDMLDIVSFHCVCSTRLPCWIYVYTPQKINMEPENTPLQKENHFPNHHFQVLC